MHVFPGERGLELLSQQFILIVFVQGLAKQSTRVRMVHERMLLVQPKASTALVVWSNCVPGNPHCDTLFIPSCPPRPTPPHMPPPLAQISFLLSAVN